jgi:peptide-methionine (S)-S-oxide reductase
MKKSIVLLAAVLGVVAVHAAPAADAPAKGETKMESATFAAGCFWGVEAEFRDVKGVKETAVGYTGGAVPKPTYEQVCAHATGHAEAVEVQFDPQVVSYGQLLDVFWKIHDPTQLNRQGPDVGDNYRSAIFCHTPEQLKAAKAALDKLQKSGKFGDRKIATQIVPAAPFYRAEEYHQRYLEKHGRARCHN